MKSISIVAKRIGNTKVQNNIDDEIKSERIKKCPECGSKSLIRDYGKAELYCAGCGLVIMENIVDLGPEWRAFSPEEILKRTRVGAPMTHRRYDKGLGTKTPVNKMPRLHRPQIWQSQSQNTKEKTFIFALSEIDRMACALKLPVDIKEAASLLYRRAMKEDLIRGRSTEGITTALLYITSRQYGVPRTLKEVGEISRVRQQKEITRAYFHLLRNLDLKVSPASPVDLVPRFCSLLNLDGEIRSKAIEIIQKAIKANLTNGPGPIGIAAAAIYIAAILSGEHCTQKEVSDATGVNEATIRNRYKEIAELLETDALFCSDGRVGRGLKRILDKK